MAVCQSKTSPVASIMMAHFISNVLTWLTVTFDTTPLGSVKIVSKLTSAMWAKPQGTQQSKRHDRRALLRGPPVIETATCIPAPAITFQRSWQRLVTSAVVLTGAILHSLLLDQWSNWHDEGFKGNCKPWTSTSLWRATDALWAQPGWCQHTPVCAEMLGALKPWDKCWYKKVCVWIH